MDPNATVGCGMPQMPNGVGAVDGVSPFEEDRPGHGGVVIFFGVVHPLKRVGTEDPVGRPVSSASGRDSPISDIVVIEIDPHSLPRFVDMDFDVGMSGVKQRFHFEVGFGVILRQGKDDPFQRKGLLRIDGFAFDTRDSFEREIEFRRSSDGTGVEKLFSLPCAALYRRNFG